MDVKAMTKYVRISAFKARDVARAIQGQPVGMALDILKFSPKKAAGMISKTLKTAIANAENNNSLNPGALWVKEAVIGEGPTIKRFQPKARGSAGPIRKRTSHIRVIVSDEVPAAVAARQEAKAKAKARGSKKTAKTEPSTETKE